MKSETNKFNNIVINSLILEYITIYKSLSAFKKRLLSRKIKKLINKQYKFIKKEIVHSMLDDQDTYNTNNIFKYIIDYSNAITTCYNLISNKSSFDKCICISGNDIPNNSLTENVLYYIKFSKLNTVNRNWVYLNEQDIEIYVYYEIEEGQRKHGGNYNIIYGESMNTIDRYYTHNLSIVSGLEDRLMKDFETCKKCLKHL